MPACTSDDNSLRFYPLNSSPSSPRHQSRSNSASPIIPSFPASRSSSVAESINMTTLKRSISDISNSSKCSSWSQATEASTSSEPSIIFRRSRHCYLDNNIQQSHVIKRNQTSTRFESLSSSSSPSQRGFFMRIIFWYFKTLFGIFYGIINTIMFIMRAPALWASVWLCIFFVILQLPLTLLKWFIAMLHTPASEIARNKRCVLISGGSTVQAVHLARNFYKAGARVVVCEVEGLFSLARFSIACSKFYTIPRPGPQNHQVTEYVQALKNIVEKEKAVYYIPVSSSNPAYYDALAKPYLENLGCESFVPNSNQVTTLDDPLELLKRCQSVGINVPVHYVLTSIDDALDLYDSGVLTTTERYVMLAAGSASGMRERIKITLPPNAQEFHQNVRLTDISDKKPWVVIKDPGGTHFITCTTVKNSQIVANVTCRVDETKGQLIPEIRNDVVDWLERFFSRSYNSPMSPVNGHLSFRLVLSEIHNETQIVSIGCRVGIGLPYVCFTSVHPRLVWRPCRHFSRQNSGPLLIGEFSNSRQSHHTNKTHEKAFPSAVKQAISNSVVNSFSNAIDKREALFVYWDPLPYCAFYHLQLPFFRITDALRARPRQHNPCPLAVVQ